MSVIQPCPICGCCVLEEDKQRLADYAALRAELDDAEWRVEVAVGQLAALKEAVRPVVEAWKDKRGFNSPDDIVTYGWEKHMTGAQLDALAALVGEE